MKILLTAPYVGEIGWELLAWQGVVRRAFRHGRFDRLAVLGTPGKAGFYADMPGEYIDVDLADLPGSAYEDRRWLEATGEAVSTESIRELLNVRVAQVAGTYTAQGHRVEELWPGYDGQFQPIDSRRQSFIRFHVSDHEPLPTPTVALIQRTRSHGKSRNWSAQRWAQLEARLNARGIHTRLYPNDARAAIEVLGAVDLAVGQSTGGMHLAGLCGCPRVVWGMEHYLWTRWEFTNRQRYETIWNPLGTPTVYHATERPPEPSDVANWVADALDALGRRTGSRVHQLMWRTRWKARACLAQQLMRGSAVRHVPWPVQRWVRYGLL
jgi:hypothetical protein